MTHKLDHVADCIEHVRRGGMIVLVDDEDRENEGDLVIAAEHCKAEHVNFMCVHGRGLICLALTSERVEHLRLPMRVHGDAGAMTTAFTVSIEARRGVTTGISAADRAETIRVASDEHYGPDDVVSPGHVFPLRAQPGGVLVRSGHTEGAIDLARLAGLRPAGVICEIMRDDGEMARLPDLEAFVRKHEMPILTIADLIAYRLQQEALVEEVARAEFASQTLGVAPGTGWTVHSYRSKVEPRMYYLALCKGNLRQEAADDPILVRAQRAQAVGDVFGFSANDSGRTIRAAVRQIDKAGRGVFLYVLGHALHDFDRALHPEREAAVAEPRPAEAGFRQFGLGAQVLKSLGLQRIRVVTNHPRKIIGLEGYGIEVTGSVPLEDT